MSAYHLVFTKLPKEFKATKLIRLKKNYTLPEAKHLFSTVQETLVGSGQSGKVGPVVLQIKPINVKADYYEFAIEVDLNALNSLDDLIHDDISSELKNLDGEEYEKFEAFDDLIAIEFDQEIPTQLESQPKSKNKSKSFSLPTRGGFNPLNSLKNKLSKEKETAVEETVSESFEQDDLTETDSEPIILELSNEMESSIEEDYVPDYESVTEEEILEELNESDKNEVAEEEVAQETVVTVVQEIQPKWVVPNLKTYLSEYNQSLFEPLDDAIKSQKEKLEKQELTLYEYFGLVNLNDYKSQLKKDFLKSRFDATFYKKNINYLLQVKSKLENGNIRFLTEAYEEVMAMNFDTEKTASVDEKHTELSEKYETKIRDLKENLSSQHEANITRAKSRHEEELANLKKRQEDELYQLNYRHTEDTHTKVQELKSLQEVELTEKMNMINQAFEEKTQKLHFDTLISKKNVVLEEAETNLVSSIESYTNQEISYMNQLKEELVSEESNFNLLNKEYQKELIEKEQREREERELRLKEKEMRLKEQRMVTDTQESQSIKAAQLEQTSQLEQMLQDQIKKNTEALNMQSKLMDMISRNNISTDGMNKQNFFDSQESVVTNGSGNKIKKYLPFVGIFVVGFAGSMLYNNLSSPNQTTAAAAVENVETIPTTIETIESQPMVETIESFVVEPQDYDSLITNGLYFEAATRFPENANDLAEQLFVEGNLEALKLVVKTVESELGELYVSISENDSEKGISAYESLDSELQKSLSEDIKRRIATFYLQEDKVDKAKSLIE